MQNELAFLSIVRMVWKRKYAILLFWVISVGITVAYVKRLPAVWAAETVILVDPQRIPASFVASTVNSTIADRVVFIREQILASSRLAPAIRDLDLFPDSRKLTAEEFSARIRPGVSIAIDKANANLIRIGYKAGDRNIVAPIANKLAAIFVDENVKNRNEVANGTLDFTETELEEARQQLDELAAAETKYKLEHNGELPSQQAQIGANLGRWQTELNTNRDMINRETQTLQTLNTRLDQAISDEEFQSRADALVATIATASTGKQVVQQGPNGTQVTVVPATPQKQSDIFARDLADLRLKYGEDHAAVKRAKALYEKALATERDAPPVVANAPAPSTASTPAPAPPPTANVVAQSAAELARLKQEQALGHRVGNIENIRTDIENVKKHIQNLNDDQPAIQKQIDYYNAKLQALPIRDQELARLTRDQATANGHYNSLMGKKLSAEMSKDLEFRQKAESFKNPEPAQVPSKPVSPDRPLMATMGSVLGFLISAALGVLLEFRRGQILGEWELPKAVVVLAHLPAIRIEGGNSGPMSFFRRSKAAAIAGVGSLLLMISALGFYFLGRI